MHIKINEKLIKYNFSSRKNTPIKYIVIHDTGNTSKGADANAHFNFFNSADRQSSAHYFVDDKQILRVVKDSDKSWHCGDGRGKYGITNENSIGVEICINNDGNYDKVIDNAIELTKYLMDKYNISVDNVVRHFDASHKTCPNTMLKNNWSTWHQFKQRLTSKDWTKTITLIYKNMFDRDPDADGLVFWGNQLNQGKTVGDMLKSMSESEEFKQKYLI